MTQSIEEKKRILLEWAGAIKSNEIIDLVDGIISDKSMPDPKKNKCIDRICLQLKYQHGKEMMFSDGKYPVPEWKLDKIEAYCKLRVDELRLKLPPIIETGEALNLVFSKYGFFELDKVAAVDRSKLIDLILRNKLPYQIAILDFLGFLDHLRIQHQCSGTMTNRILSMPLKRCERDIKGNISSLHPKSKERERGRFTAYKHIEVVKKDYQELI